MNYFTLFNIPEEFKINKKLLSKNFYKLQLKFHPDLFINDSELKKKMLEKSIEINKGYKTLKNFLSRAIYLLFLNGFEIKKEVFLLQKNNFLIKYFSLYEELDNLKENNFQGIQLNNYKNKIEKRILNCQKKIEIAFEKKKYEKIIKLIEELSFFEKLKDNLKKAYNTYLRHIN